MNKLYILALSTVMLGNIALCAETAFDSMDKAVEVKLAPTLKTAANTQTTKTTVSNAAANSVNSTNIQIQKFNNALVNLDDAQVELRQDLATISAKYNDALVEKEKAVLNCKTLKNEIKAINKKMKNIEKSKKMINANLESAN